MTNTKNKNDLKTCILESAAKLFSRLGVEKTSTRDISKASNANISLISYHFGGKEGLYKEVIRDFALKVQEQTSQYINDFEKTELTKEAITQELRVMISIMVNMRLKHPEISKILAREKIEGMPICHDVHDTIFYPMVQKFIKRIQAAQEKKIIRDDVSPSLIFVLISEGTFGYFELMDCQGQFEQDLHAFKDNYELLIEQILNIFTKGVLL